jgi:hypothetical protein
MANSETKKKINWQILILWIIVIIGFVYFIFRFTFFKTSKFEKPKSDWQAVFLTNDQVYFGKIVKMTEKEVVMKNVFYSQAAQFIPASKEGHVTSAQVPFLVKLGNELHQPLDEIRINRDHILFIEDLKESSPIIESIKQYKSE